ncbi:MAG: NlpC/P60 family protein [Brevinematia bacterium]
MALIFIPALIFPADDSFYERIVDISRKSIGLKKIPSVGGKNFTSDCIGFVRYVYYKAGVDLLKLYGYGRGGVSSVYDGMKKRNWIYEGKIPALGDLIFFDNTYDVNRDRKWNDALTHIGIVTGYGKNNTIFFVHYASGGVKEDRINLFYPNTHAFRQKNGTLYVINSHLRFNRGEGYSRKDYLASSFFRCFGRVHVRKKNE